MSRGVTGWYGSEPGRTSGAGARARVVGLCALGPLLVIAALAAGVRAEEKTENYGRTPDSVIPYRNFHDPYFRFFQSVLPYRGTGRDKDVETPGGTIRIGVLAPVEPAPDADLGEELIRGVTLAVEEANAAGGYAGVPLAIVRRADVGLWGATSNEMVGFAYEDHVVAVIGSIDGANTHVALRATLKTKIPIVNTGTTDPTLTETNIPWLVRCMADDRQQGYALAYHMIREAGARRIVALRVNDRFGRTGIAEFRDAARRLRRPLLAELRWERGDRDFSIQLRRLEALEPDAVVIWSNARDAAALVRALRGHPAGRSVAVYGCDRLVSRTFLEQAGRAAEGVVAVATWDPTRADPQLERFAEAFRARFGVPPGTFAAHAYDGARILIEAIRQAGPNPTRIRDALYEMESFEGVTGPIRFDTTMNDVGPVYLAVVRGGEFVYQEIDFSSMEGLSRGAVQPYRSIAESVRQRRRSQANDDPAPTVRTRARQSEMCIGLFVAEEHMEAVRRGAEAALAERGAGAPTVRLVAEPIRGTWESDADRLVRLVHDAGVIALVGSTERKGTHLAETLAAKMHVPVISLCRDDPTITAIPLPWVFQVAGDVQIEKEFALRFAERYGSPPDEAAAAAYDAVALLARAVASGARTRAEVRDFLAQTRMFSGATGEFGFDELGNRVAGEVAAARREGCEGTASLTAGHVATDAAGASGLEVEDDHHHGPEE